MTKKEWVLLLSGFMLIIVLAGMTYKTCQNIEREQTVRECLDRGYAGCFDGLDDGLQKQLREGSCGTFASCIKK